MQSRQLLLISSVLVHTIIVIPTFGVNMELGKKHSGYSSNASNWLTFLTCWYGDMTITEDETSYGLLRLSNTLLPAKSPEQTLTIETYLPPSITDFYKAYEKLGGIYRDDRFNDGIGVFSPQDIQPLSAYMSELLRIKNELPFESTNDDYFRYGIEQDNAQIRTSYQNNAIVIGQYGWSDYELIVVYPDSKTADGEMETAIFAHASETRTPSFAEMMRQLSFYYISKPDSTPLYSQEMLSGTCADKLLLKNIWWK